jgi:hypothetical protein
VRRLHISGATTMSGNAFPAERRCPRCDGYGFLFRLGVRCLDPFHDQAIFDPFADGKADQSMSPTPVVSMSENDDQTPEEETCYWRGSA